MVPISAIHISPTRQRREHDEAMHQELVESISKLGVLHPPVVREEGGSLHLVAGERRLRAMTEIWDFGGVVSYQGAPLPRGTTPITHLGDLPPLLAEEAELDENIRRKNLTWQELADATARLTSLRTRQADAAGEIPPHPSDIAKEVYENLEPATASNAVRRDLILAKHLHDPEVRAAKTADEALKLLKKKESRAKNLARAQEIGQTAVAEGHTLLNVDSLEWMKEAPGGTFDVILTDPPYGMGADEFGDSDGRAEGAHGYVDDELSFRSIMGVLAPESFRLAKGAAHLYCFCDIGWFPDMRNWFSTAGWRVFRTPFIWHKPNGMRAPWPQQGPQRAYECILYAVKGDLPVTRMAKDVLPYPPDENLGHGAQKPVALFRDLLSRSATPGMKVLDPFTGTGGVLEAAQGLHCFATCLEKDPASFGIAAGRLAKIKGGAV